MGAVKARTILWYLVFIGFAVNFMYWINMNITIVEMIATNDIDPYIEENTLTTRLYNQTKNITSFGHAEVKSRYYSLEQHFLNWSKIDYERNGFQWNEYQQGLVLGSFYWAHWISQIPGGILAKKYGTKLVFGLSNVICCWICALIPISSYLDYRILILLRVLQGIISGVAWPAMHVLPAKWIPPNERSKFVTSYLGCSVGIAVFYPFFGYVMHWSSWEWVFHICAIIGTFWWFGWLLFVYDTPAEHPWISEAEARYIKKSLGASSQYNKCNEATPWRDILTSRPVWINIIAMWGGIWGLLTLMTQAPTYFRVIHNLNIRTTGGLSGLPHLMRMLFGLVFSWVGDYLLEKNKISRTNLRKLAAVFCYIFNGLAVLALAYCGHDVIAAIIFLTVATMLHGAISTGPLASMVDIAPNHAGVILGLSGMIGVLPGFISPWIVGILTLQNQTYEAWKNVFLMCAGMLIGSGVLYIFYSDSSLQAWNSSSTAKSRCFKELKPLNEVPIKIEQIKHRIDDRRQK